MARSDFDPSDAVEFWDVVDHQDRKVCEGAQRGMSSPQFDQGLYAPMENYSMDIRL